MKVVWNLSGEELEIVRRANSANLTITPQVRIQTLHDNFGDFVSKFLFGLFGHR